MIEISAFIAEEHISSYSILFTHMFAFWASLARITMVYLLHFHTGQRRLVSLRLCRIEPVFVILPQLSPVPRQNSIHLYFQQLRSSFSQPLFSKSKFALSVGGSLITASLQLTLDVCKCMKRKNDGLFDRDTAARGENLATRFCDALFDYRYMDVEVFWCWNAWSAWFHDVA
jgi:hypothetical protein